MSSKKKQTVWLVHDGFDCFDVYLDEPTWENGDFYWTTKYGSRACFCESEMKELFPKISCDPKHCTELHLSLGTVWEP